MLFGIGCPSYGAYTDPGLIREVIRRAEDYGYYSIWFPDHIVIDNNYLTDMGRCYYDPFSLCGYAAAMTKRIKIGIAVVVVPYRHPAITAKMVATLDQLTAGRFIMGIGPGYMEGEYAAIDVPFKSRGPMTDEYILAMKELWTKDNPQFSGRFVKFSDVTLEPKPVQKPHPPIFVGGNSAPAIRRAANLGNAWHPVGLSPEDLAKGMASVRAQAKAAGRTDRIMFSTQGQWVRITDVPKGQKPAMRNGVRVGTNGTAAEIIADLKEYKKVGVEHLILRFSKVPDAKGYLEAFEFFHKNILPAVKD